MQTQPSQAGKIQAWIFCTVSIIILFVGFAFNAWGIADQKSFERFQRDGESLIIGRLVQSRHDGIFSAGGLTGADIDHSLHDTWITPKESDRQDLAYFDDIPTERYSPYLSQIGGQGMMFSVLDRLIRISSTRTKYEIFRGITAGLSALTLALVVFWFHAEFGLGSAILVLASLVLSQWLTLFGRNLWWSLWAFYLPMLLLMLFLRRYPLIEKRHFLQLVSLAALAAFLKCFFNGYEFITTALVMLSVPFVYYAILCRMNKQQFFNGAASVIMGASAGVLASVVMLIFQIGAAQGNPLGGLEHLTATVEKRTYGDASDFNSEFSDSLDASTFGVVLTYIQGSFLELGPASDSAGMGPVIEVRYWHLIVSFAVMSVLALFAWRKNHPPEENQRAIALVGAMWYSILAPLSWYVIFKSHSDIHTHINFVIWQMPFTLFGFAVWGIVIQRGLLAWTRRAG